VTATTRTRPRLVHVTTSDISLSLLLGSQLQAFAAAGYEVIGVSAAGEHVADLERMGIRHVALRHATRSFAPGGDARALLELWSLFRELEPDIVHTHNPKPGIYGRLAARAAGVPVVVNTVHGLYALPDDRLAKRALVYGLERAASLCSDAELVQSAEDVDTLLRIGVARDKVYRLGNGIDLDRFRPCAERDERALEERARLGIAADDVVCGLVGRLVREKGYLEVFAAYERLRERLPRLHVVVVGPSDPEKADALSADEIDAAERAGVRFLGFEPKVEDVYAWMDCFVLASHREGFPRAAMEAAAMGLPVIATDIRGCREVVADGETGFLVPPRDVDALAAAVEHITVDAELRARMGAAASEKARREFDQQDVIDLTLRVYHRLLPARPDPPAVELRAAVAADAPALAAMHVDRIDEGFLSSLGPRFLRRLYKRIIAAPGAFAIVAVDECGVVGFVAVATDVPALYKAFVLRDGVGAGLVAAPRLARSARRAFETLRYPATEGTGGGDDLPAAEILSVGVAPRATRRGVGTRLLAAALDELRARDVDAVKVVAGADNDAALGLYERSGFARERTIAVHAGTPSEVLVWRSR
jgi:glycosyltransferase involved in cell wall biosynthesis/ribosomal protein S18 acetylase RimI-like enzyme